MALSKAKKKYLQVFLRSYTTEFPCFVTSRKGDKYGFCTTCACDVSVSHGGKADIRIHIASQKHQNYVRAAEGQGTIGSFLQNNSEVSVIRAECLFTGFLVEHNLPLSVSDHAGPLFRKMFPKCDDAKRYGCGRTKATAIVGEMAADAESSMLESLKRRAFAIAVDGSNDSGSQMYPIVATYYVEESRNVESRLLCLQELHGEATGRKIGNLVLDALKSCDIPMKNCIAFCADNANVMIGKKNGVAAVLKEAQESLIVVGCPCHLINLAAEKGAACLPAKFDEVLVDIFYFLEKSAKRKDRLVEFQEMHNTEVRKILKHVPTRWLSLGKCLTRLLEQWQPLVSFFLNETKPKNQQRPPFLGSYQIPKRAAALGEDKQDNVDQDRQKRKEPRGKVDATPAKRVKFSSESTGHASLTREERLFYFLTSDVNLAYGLFLKNVIPIFERVNCQLQSQAPQVHLLQSLLVQLLRDLMARFVNPSAMKACASPLEVPYQDLKNQKADEDLVLGSRTLSVVEGLPTSDKQQFFSAVRQYFAVACDYIRHKFPLEDATLKKAEVANLKFLSSASFKSLGFFIESFPQLLSQEKNMSREEALDALEVEFAELQAYDVSKDILNEERIDIQWSEVGRITSIDGKVKFGRVAKVMLQLLAIPHSNAECERIFSTVKKTRTEFRSSLSNKTLGDLLMVKGHQSGHCFERTYSDKFLKLAKSATARSLHK